MEWPEPPRFEKNTDAPHYALFSGGYDSLVLTHYVIESDRLPVDRVLYLDTNTGIPENKEWVEEVCEEYGWPLRVEQSDTNLYEYATGANSDRQALGFPSPRNHSWIYRYLKERPLREVARSHSGKPHYWTGVRVHESDNRMENVDVDGSETEYWFWHAPISNWTDTHMERYREKYDLPTSPVVEAINRSGDCFCGAFDARMETLIDLEAHYPDHAEWIRETEERVQEEIGADKRLAYWGFGKEDEKELRRVMAKRDEAQMTLCSTCSIPDLDEPLPSVKRETDEADEEVSPPPTQQASLDDLDDP